MKLIFLIVSMLSFTSQLFAQEKVVYPDIIVFTSPDRCLPCRKQEPIISKIEKKFLCVRVYVDLEQNITRLHKVFSIPTIIILKDGVEFERFVGLTEEEFIKKSLEKRKK